ncbi:MAG: hypothetical protein ACE5FD_09800 [Anaerolineae bacterium]
MSRKTWYRIHKWFSITVGIFFLAWTGSGIVMTLPPGWFEPKEMISEAPVSYDAAVLSPAEAVAAVGEAVGKEITPDTFSLHKLNGRLLYGLNIPGEFYLVDATTGDIVQIDEALATDLVTAQTDTAVRDAELLTKHDLRYPFGPLPVYRVDAADGADSFYVNFWNGRVSQSTTLTRIKAAIVSLHTFEPLKLLVNREDIKNNALILFSVVGIGTALTGYYLAILPYMKKKTKSEKRNG